MSPLQAGELPGRSVVAQAVAEDPLDVRGATRRAGDHRWRTVPASALGRRGAGLAQLAIGPGGFFALAQVSCPGAEVLLTHRGLQIDGVTSEVTRRTRERSVVVARSVSQALGRRLGVIAVVVLTDAASLRVMGQPPGTAVVPRGQLALWLVTRPTTMHEEDMARVWEIARTPSTWTDPLRADVRAPRL